MSWEFCETTIQMARKEYRCDGTHDFFDNGCKFSDYKITLSEAKVLVQARKDGYKILKGIKYLKCKGRYDGEFSVYRCRKDVYDVLDSCGFYRDWD